jgi:beta-lactam-binding protein with PASTA domain
MSKLFSIVFFVFTASAFAWPWPQNPQPTPVPEIGGSSAVQAAALLSGAVLVVRGRRKK